MCVFFFWRLYNILLLVVSAHIIYIYIYTMTTTCIILWSYTVFRVGGRSTIYYIYVRPGALMATYNIYLTAGQWGDGTPRGGDPNGGRRFTFKLLGRRTRSVINPNQVSGIYYIRVHVHDIGLRAYDVRFFSFPSSPAKNIMINRRHTYAGLFVLRPRGFSIFFSFL